MGFFIKVATMSDEMMHQGLVTDLWNAKSDANPIVFIDKIREVRITYSITLLPLAFSKVRPCKNDGDKHRRHCNKRDVPIFKLGSKLSRSVSDFLPKA